VVTLELTPIPTFTAAGHRRASGLTCIVKRPRLPNNAGGKSNDLGQKLGLRTALNSVVEGPE